MAVARCPLCEKDGASLFFADRVREYHACDQCQLIFVPKSFHLQAAEEKAVYDHHENSPDDERYRAFLGRLFDPIQNRISPRSSGLDFGSGPGPTLSVMFQEAGHQMAIYDPFYSPGTQPLEQEYDFVTCSEVVEHLCRPRDGLDRIWNCVREGGVLGVMTQMSENHERFKTWHYKNDPTHVSFFSVATFGWLARHWQADLTVIDNRVSLFSKPYTG